MTKRCARWVAIAAAAATAGGCVGLVPVAASAAATTTIANSTVSWASPANSTGAVAAGQQLSVQLWLAPKASAATYAEAVSTPGNSEFHRYLTPDQYTSRYAASSADASRVGSWLRSRGFDSIRTSAGRDYVSAQASVATIDRAFDTQMRYYKTDRAQGLGTVGGARLEANDANLRMPSSIASLVSGVTGLDNAAPQLNVIAHKTAAAKTTHQCSNYYGQYWQGGLPSKWGKKRYPDIVCGYNARQLRGAYGLTKADTGAGQTVAVVEDGVAHNMFKTLQIWASKEGAPAPSASRYKQVSLGKNTCGDPFDVEEQMDVESSYAMAPKEHLVVVEADSCSIAKEGLQTLLDADQAIVQGNGHKPLATIASNSWGDTRFGETMPSSIVKVQHNQMLKAAAEGVGMYWSAGDDGSATTPASDPFSISVGATALGISKSDQRMWETGWSTGVYIPIKKHWIFAGTNGMTGGGPSMLWAEPSYQKGVVPKSMTVTGGNKAPGRVGPDLSADGDPSTGIAVGMYVQGPHGGWKYTTEAVGGTSLSSPLVAGIMADAQQSLAKPIGFADPVLYKLYGTKAFNDALPVTSKTVPSRRASLCPKGVCDYLPVLFTFDYQNRWVTGTDQVTAKGYDTMTGLGTPHGQYFIGGVRRLAR